MRIGFLFILAQFLKKSFYVNVREPVNAFQLIIRLHLSPKPLNLSLFPVIVGVFRQSVIRGKARILILDVEAKSAVPPLY